MHAHVVPNRGSSPTVLLRGSYRGGAKVAKRTLFKRLRENFGIERLVLVSDRSMISNKAIGNAPASQVTPPARPRRPPRTGFSATLEFGSPIGGGCFDPWRQST